MRVVAGNARDAAQAGGVGADRIDLPVAVFSIARERDLLAVRRPGGEVVVLPLALGQHRNLCALDIYDPQSLAAFVLRAKNDAAAVRRPGWKPVVAGAFGEQLEAAAVGRHDRDVRDLAADAQRALKRTARSERDAIAARRPRRRDGVALEIVVNQPPVRSVGAGDHDAVVQQRRAPGGERETIAGGRVAREDASADKSKPRVGTGNLHHRRPALSDIAMKDHAAPVRRPVGAAELAARTRAAAGEFQTAVRPAARMADAIR